MEKVQSLSLMHSQSSGKGIIRINKRIYTITGTQSNPDESHFTQPGLEGLAALEIGVKSVWRK